MGQVEDSKSIMKLSYAWIIIMLAINLFYIGYVTTDQDFADGDALYNLFMAEDSTSEVQITELENEFNDYTNKTVVKQGDTVATILDFVDGLLDFAGWVGFIGTMITFGGFYTSFKVWSMVDNNFIRLIIQLFLIIGNIIWGIQIFRFIFNRRGEV